MMKDYNDAVQFFSSLADETRLKILVGLMEESKNVGEIHKFVGGGITLSAISHQLKLLSSLKIVIPEKKGREKHFTLSKSFCWCILRDAFAHLGKKTECRECTKIRGKI